MRILIPTNISACEVNLLRCPPHHGTAAISNASFLHSEDAADHNSDQVKLAAVMLSAEDSALPAGPFESIAKGRFAQALSEGSDTAAFAAENDRGLFTERHFLFVASKLHLGADAAVSIYLQITANAHFGENGQQLAQSYPNVRVRPDLQIQQESVSLL